MTEHKPLPPLMSRSHRAWLFLWSILTWPRDVRQLKAAGAVRCGFMHWELPPAPRGTLDDLAMLLTERARSYTHDRLLCHPGVADALKAHGLGERKPGYQPPPELSPSGALAMVWGVGIIREPEMAPGHWVLETNGRRAAEGILDAERDLSNGRDGNG